jgi:RNA polymerase sigma-70 factor (ECF subfamily)
MPARAFVQFGADSEMALGKGAPAAEVACPDSVLVEAAQLGNNDAFGALVDRYHRRIHGVVYRMCGATDAEDITQDIFLRVLQALRGFKFQGEASFRTWLYRIAVNACINELRRRKRRRDTDGPSLDEVIETPSGAFSRSIPDYSQMPDVEVERQELCAAVHAALRSLSPRHRIVLTLIDLQGMEYEEAAQVMGCPLGTLKSRVARARDAFAVAYRRYEQGTLQITQKSVAGVPQGNTER